ncbi:LytTR family transcriptional regulator DNA-binding domain-containing protein [Aquimarina sp. D1M17]|uniref:LytR/AlgR family response regulator transcription factor n=1 Tax=Aquimarina acroporae TaxID=2937283 RepID=UPI0020BE9B8A|nr:LytTR family transcriptional regulator DNA-binding domain-containing protein [Aquimarina acroporae]MCK8520112.1 LytTR family transcriptional regulator DNA-binding domain-containing protein [Aquimarina acroporae]
MNKIKTLIVDDEVLARDKLTLFLQNEKDFEIVEQCSNGIEALKSIKTSYPDLLFLDIQMPEMDGMELLRNIDVQKIPCIILVTAYDDYAIKAFEYHALDYLLKPFDRERFLVTISRVREQMELHSSGDYNRQLLNYLRDTNDSKKHIQKVVVKDGGKIFFVKTKDIEWVESAGNYLKLHVGKSSHLIRETMNAFEQKLNPSEFIRIHRSSLVNIDTIHNLESWGNTEFIFTLNSGHKVQSGRSYYTLIRQKLQL